MSEAPPIMPPILRRRNAAQATLDAFEGKAFRMGHVDCVRMAAHHLRLLGYKIRLPAKGSYRTIRSGRAQLAARGFANLTDAVDSTGLARKAPAGMIVGDIAVMEDRDGIGGLVIALGNGRVLGFHEDLLGRGALVLQPVGVPDIVWDGVPA